MEMHQVRYFLAVTRTLNFTRAAEECHVAQPSLTRAIKQLEDEFGGELFRRERNLTHLSDLGHRMLPLMQQCFASANAAKSLASSLKSGAVAPLSLAISRAINITLLVPHLTELTRVFKGLELGFLRGTREEVADFLKKGDAELAIAGPFAETWDRLDAWPLFTEPYKFAVNDKHKLADRRSITLKDIGQERLIARTYCELADTFAGILKNANVTPSVTHKMVSEYDYVAMIEAGLGVGMLPMSAPPSQKIKRLDIGELDLNRTVTVYGVAGRQRSTAATTLVKMLRAADWSAFEKPDAPASSVRSSAPR